MFYVYRQLIDYTINYSLSIPKKESHTSVYGILFSQSIIFQPVSRDELPDD